MAPKHSLAHFQALAEKERVRKRVLELHHAGGLSLAQIAGHPDVLKSKATVQSMIKTFGSRPTMEAKKSPGRSTKMTFRYISSSLGHISTHYPPARFKRDLRRLAVMNPYWGCGKLADAVHKKLMDGLSNWPPGAVVRVCTCQM